MLEMIREYIINSKFFDIILILDIISPLHIIILGFTALCVVKSLRILKQLSDKKISADISKQLDYLLIFGLTVLSISILSPFLEFFLGCFSILNSGGSGDPRLVFPALFQALAQTFFYILLGSLIILIWSILNFYKKSLDKK